MLAGHAYVLPTVVSVGPGRAEAMSARREAALVRAAQGGDRAAVEALFAAHWPALHRGAWLITRDPAAAEDIAQEAFLAALAALDRFDRRRRLGPWLGTIVARRAIDYARARAVRGELSPDTLDHLATGPDRTPALDDEVLGALGELDRDRRTVVVLRHLLELKPRQIADLLDVPVGTVNSRLRRGLDQLQAVLGDRRG